MFSPRNIAIISLVLMFVGCENETCQDCYDDLDACHAKAHTTSEILKCSNAFAECYNRAKKYDPNCE